MKKIDWEKPPIWIKSVVAMIAAYIIGWFVSATHAEQIIMYLIIFNGITK